MELGLLRDFLGIFSTSGERYYFYVDEMDARWGCSHKVRIPTQGENGHMK